MKRWMKWSALSLALFATLACTARPERVCRHLDELGASPPEDIECMALMRTIQTERPDEWADIGPCFMSSVDKEETSVCWDMISLLAMQRACSQVAEAVPDAFSGSGPACLRALRAYRRQDSDLWRQKMSCVANADSITALSACEVAGALGERESMQLLEGIIAAPDTNANEGDTPSAEPAPSAEP